MQNDTAKIFQSLRRESLLLHSEDQLRRVLAGSKPYERSTQAGGTEMDGNRLEDKVMDVAIDLRRLCNQFLAHAKSDFRDNVRNALGKAVVEAQKASDQYGMENPYK